VLENIFEGKLGDTVDMDAVKRKTDKPVTNMEFRMKKFAVFIIFAMILISSPALGEDAVPRAWGPANVISGPAGMGFPVGKLAAVLNYKYAETDGIRHHGDELNDDVKLTKNVYVAKLRYGIAPGLDIRSATPMYDVDVDYKSSVPKDDYTQNWIGDTTLVLHKVVMNQARGNFINMAFDIGATFPTANVDSESNDFIGNDAWGGFAGVGFTYFLGSNRFDQEFNYAFFTEGAHDYTKPNRFRSNTTWAYAFNNYFDIGVESNLEWNNESEKNGVGQNDSKLEWYAGPKMAFKYRPWGVNVATLVTFPVKRWYEGTSPSDEYTVQVKIAKLFNF